jgi:Protein of unknown function (DUF4232)
MDDEIRKLLRQKGDEVPPHRKVPESLKPRVRRRIARNVAAIGAMFVLLGAGTFVGARALNAPGSTKPIRPASTPTVQPTSPASVTACTSGQLRAVGSLQGAAGSRTGAITVTNFSDVTCTLQGAASIRLLDQNLKPITSGIVFSSGPAIWQVNASPTPPWWPIVTLAPGQTASVRTSWSNWCPDGRPSPLWQVEVPGGGTVNVNGLDAAGPPPCNGQGQPSTIELGPFEPGSGG